MLISLLTVMLLITDPTLAYGGRGGRPGFLGGSLGTLGNLGNLGM